MRRTLAPTLALLLAACADQTCPEEPPACPEGTLTSITVHSRTSLDVDVEVDGTHGEGTGDYDADETCTFTCVAITPCAEGEAEVITDDCFTCAPLDEEGLLIEPHACSPGGLGSFGEPTARIQSRPHGG